MTANIEDKINQLKKEQDVLILAHNYQPPEIQNIADIIGDSLELAKAATAFAQETILFCGVLFMAETAKILSPDKTVLLPQKEALCPMANMINATQLRELKTKHPKATVVTYVNSTAEVKAESDVCCTSANAVKITQNIKTDEIIFAPDKNLAAYCARFTNKKIIPWDGYCYVHNDFSRKEILKYKQDFPRAILLAHPECPPEVIDISDEVLSTSGILNFVKVAPEDTFLIATEEGILYRLKKENPNKNFYSAGIAKICTDMKKTTLVDVYNALTKGQFSVNLSAEVVIKAQKSLKEMLQYI